MTDTLCCDCGDAETQLGKPHILSQSPTLLCAFS